MARFVAWGNVLPQRFVKTHTLSRRPSLSLQPVRKDRGLLVTLGTPPSSSHVFGIYEADKSVRWEAALTPMCIGGGDLDGLKVYPSVESRRCLGLWALGRSPVVQGLLAKPNRDKLTLPPSPRTSSIAAHLADSSGSIAAMASAPATPVRSSAANFIVCCAGAGCYRH